MSSIIDKLREWLAGTAPPTASPADPAVHKVPLDDAAVEKLILALSMTRDDELSCAEVFALLDEYSELAVTDHAKAAALMPLVEMHLAMCTDCHDNYDALCDVLETEDDLPAAEA